MAGTPEHTLDRLDKLADKLAEANGSAEDSNDRLNKIEKAVKWASPWRQLVGFAVFLIVGAVAVYGALRDYARVQVIETVRAAHAEDEAPVEPSVQTVTDIQTDMGSVKAGVDELVAEKEQRRKMKGVELELDLHREQHRQLLQEWSAKKAARRQPGQKPTKGDRHLQLEADLKRLASEKL